MSVERWASNLTPYNHRELIRPRPPHHDGLTCSQSINKPNLPFLRLLLVKHLGAVTRKATDINIKQFWPSYSSLLPESFCLSLKTEAAVYCQAFPGDCKTLVKKYVLRPWDVPLVPSSEALFLVVDYPVNHFLKVMFSTSRDLLGFQSCLR